MVWGGDVGFGLLRVPQLCAKPYPAEPRCDICGLPRVFFILGRDFIALGVFDFVFLGLPIGVWMVSGGDVGVGFLRVPQLCAKPYPAEPRCDICGLLRGFLF